MRGNSFFLKSLLIKFTSKKKKVIIKFSFFFCKTFLVQLKFTMTKMHLNLRYASKFIKHIYYVFTNNKKFQELTLSYRKKE